MANTKEYKIVINGLQESINAVETLNKQLDNLEQRMNRLNQTRVSTGGASRGGNTSALSDEERVQKEINKLKEEGQKLDAKIAASQDEIYKRVDATKQLYKETIADQKAIAAQERLVANSYSNTMQGMKSKLADIKSVINTTDLGDGDQINRMTQEANELTNKLKEMEAAYGQFGRNVGNYQSAFDGMQKLSITIGGVTREFNSAREASKTLKNELVGLEAAGQGNTEVAKELRTEYYKLQSAIDDATKSSKAMDEAMDMMQSFTAMASIGQGFKAFFGFDESEIQKSIQRLVALQNVLKGIEVINKQIQTGEGIGKWIRPFNADIDNATSKLLVYNRALLGTGTAAKTAAAGIKLFSKAIKAIASAGIIVVLDLIIEKLMELIDSFKKVDEQSEKTKKEQEEVSKAYAEASAKITTYTAKVKNFNGTKKQEKKLVEELNRELGSSLGTYNSLAQWMDVLIKKGGDYVKMLTLQAKAQAAFNNLVEAQQAKMKFDNSDLEDYEKWYDGILEFVGSGGNARKREKEFGKQIKENLSAAEKGVEDANKELQDFMEKKGIGDYSPQIEKGGRKTKDAIEKTDKTITDLELRLMRDGLNKRLRQLDEEERQTINKLRENGRKSAAEIEKVHRQFDLLRKKEIDEYLKNVEQSIATTAENIKKVGFEINTSKLQNQLSKLQNEFEVLSQSRPIRNMYISQSETSSIKKDYKVDDKKVRFANEFLDLIDYVDRTKKVDEYYSFLNNYIKDKDRELFADISDYNKAIYETTDEEQKQVYMKGLEDTYKKVSNLIEEEYANELLYIRNYTHKIDQTLTDSFKFRIDAEEEYDNKVRDKLLESIKEQRKLNEKLVNEQENAADDAENARYEAAQGFLEKQKSQLEESIKNAKARNEKEVKQLEQMKDDLKRVNDQMETQRQQHYDKLEQIDKERQNKEKQIEINSKKELADVQEKYFENQITNIRDAQSKINELLSKQPVYNSFGIVNVSATKKQYEEIKDAAEDMVKEIIAQQQLLNAAFSNGLIKPETLNAIKTQLNDLFAAFKQVLIDIENSSKDTIPKFIQSLNVYLQAGVQSFQDIMSAVWDAQDTQFDKEQEYLDKMNELLDKKLDEQEDIIQEHKNNVDSIEDELANSRGDRRQHLIDQLNAEMAAERAAEKEKQRIEKEREANEKKQDALEKKRKKAQYKRDLIQAVVNGAMAVTYAAMNTYPVPAIPLMALAAATTAAQLAIMTANKPYAKGGLLEGKSHAQGGIPIPGTGIEVEGKEYVIRKRSTAQNIDLLDYINRSERKLDLGDFIDFYSSKVRKNVSQMSPGRKYADGGALPTIANTYEFDDRLLNAMEDYSNRPVVVSVVDINDRQAAVKNVQVLAGLN